MRPLGPAEKEIVGGWLRRDGQFVGDEACERIEWLIRDRLEVVAKDASGWETLFRDPSDGRFWVRTFPQSEMHGGGPPSLYLTVVKYSGELHEARVKWSEQRTKAGLPSVALLTRPCQVSPGAPPEDDGMWSLVCIFDTAPNLQGTPTAARVAFLMDGAPHERLVPGSVMLMHDGEYGWAEVEVTA